MHKPFASTPLAENTVSTDEPRVPYAWPIEQLPAVFDVPLNRVEKAVLRKRISDVRQLFNDLHTYEWRHYKGTVYRVTGFGVSSRDGQVEIEYTEIATRPGGDSVTFHLPIHVWFSTVVLDKPDPDSPNLVEPDAVFMVHRYVPVFEATRFETQAQINERDGIKN